MSDHPARGLVAALGLGVAVTGLSATAGPALANPAGTGLVISEVYGAGGNSGATYNADFVELYNPTTAADRGGRARRPVPQRGAGATAASPPSPAASRPGTTSWCRCRSASATVGAALPTPDVVSGSNINMSGANGQVLLLPGTTPSTASGDLAGNPGVLDAVGFGTTPTSYEGAATGVALTSTTSAQRAAAGTDSDNNADDFSEALPTPRTPAAPRPPPPAEFTGSIAEIQGTDTDTARSPATTVTTEGVVTAAYPTGGFNGFYLQTAGTGGGTDATPAPPTRSSSTASAAAGDRRPSATTSQVTGAGQASSAARPRSTVADRPTTSPPLADAARRVRGLAGRPPDRPTPRGRPTRASCSTSRRSTSRSPTTTPPTSSARSAWPPATTRWSRRPRWPTRRTPPAIAGGHGRQRRPRASRSTTARASTSCRQRGATRTSRCRG